MFLFIQSAPPSQNAEIYYNVQNDCALDFFIDPM